MKLKNKKSFFFCSLGIMLMLAFSFLLLTSCGVGNIQQPMEKKTQEEAKSDNKEKSIAKEEYGNAANKYNKDGYYKNGNVLKYNYGKGTLTVGTNANVDDKHIYLDIKSSQAADGNEIGYYVESSRVDVQISPIEGGNLSCNVGANSSESNFVIKNLLYNDIVPSVYRDKENYGIRWCDDLLEDGKNAGTTISIRAFNLTTNALVCMCDAKIEYNKKDNSYELVSLESSDVKDRKELTDDSRENLVNAAREFIAERLQIDKNTVFTAGAIVDKHEVTYFPRFLDVDGKIIYYKDYATCKDTYAVTLPVSLYGHATVYFAPETQLMGLTSPSAPGESDLRLKLFAYDALNPKDEHTIMAPAGFLY